MKKMLLLSVSLLASLLTVQNVYGAVSKQEAAREAAACKKEAKAIAAKADLSRYGGYQLGRTKLAIEQKALEDCKERKAKERKAEERKKREAAAKRAKEQTYGGYSVRLSRQRKAEREAEERKKKAAAAPKKPSPGVGVTQVEKVRPALAPTGAMPMVEYIDINELHPGQLRFTQPNIDTKKAKLGKAKGQFDTGKSSLAEKDAIPVVKGPGDIGFVAVDSHHDYLAAKALGDQSVPIKLKEDLSNLSREKFYETALEKNYIYPYNLEGEQQPLPTTGWFAWEKMQDDPNRLLAAFTAWKCAKEEAENKYTGFKDPNASEDPKYPLWVKRLWEKVKLAFIEFKMATQLYKSGIKYSYDMGQNPNEEKLAALIERAREVLRQNPIEGLDLVYPKASRDDLNATYEHLGGICAYTYIVSPLAAEEPMLGPGLKSAGEMVEKQPGRFETMAQSKRAVLSGEKDKKVQELSLKLMYKGIPEVAYRDKSDFLNFMTKELTPDEVLPEMLSRLNANRRSYIATRNEDEKERSKRRINAYKNYIKYLIEAGADVNVKFTKPGETFMTPLQLVAALEATGLEDKEFRDWLGERGAN